MYTNLISVEQLSAVGRQDEVAVFDCRHDLMKPAWGREAYLQSHIPGAMYVSLDKDLSGPALTDKGRHPMLSADAMRALFSRIGIGAQTQVVAYDQRDGSIAARLWWMLRYMGHEKAAVLNGGFPAWQRAQLPVEAGEQVRSPERFTGEPRRDRLVLIDELPTVPRIVDARLAARYRGEMEPLDRVPGHIPGARNLPFMDNVDAHGLFVDRQAARTRFETVFEGTPAAQVVYACGSGVTACHLALAAHWIGLEDGRIYAGSYSEWSRDPARPIATGAAPGAL